MKTIVTLIAFALFTSISYGQQALELKVLRGADAPNTSTQQYYLLEVSNNYEWSEEIVFVIEDVNCQEISANDQISLSRALYNREKTTQIQSLYVEKNKKGTFFLKIFRSSTTVTGGANKWNCLSVKATAKNGTVYSNKVTIQSLIPNPKNNN